MSEQHPQPLADSLLHPRNGIPLQAEPEHPLLTEPVVETWSGKRIHLYPTHNQERLFVRPVRNDIVFGNTAHRTSTFFLWPVDTIPELLQKWTTHPQTFTDYTFNGQSFIFRTNTADDGRHLLEVQVKEFGGPTKYVVWTSIVTEPVWNSILHDFRNIVRYGENRPIPNGMPGISPNPLAAYDVHSLQQQLQPRP